MKFRHLLIASVALSAQWAFAADITPAKKGLIEHVLKLWNVETVGGKMLLDPVAEMLRQSNSLLQARVSEEKKTAVMKEINDDARKFLEENLPVIKDAQDKLLATTVEPILDKNFNEDELKQIIAILENPVKKKFDTLIPDMQKALGTKLGEVEGPVIKPKMDALSQKIGERMKAAVNGQ